MSSARPGTLFPEGEALNESDYQRLADFIEQRSGIKLPASKRVLLEGRLRKRLRQLHLDSFGAYCRFLFENGNADDEEVEILDAVTTNKTDFFRENHHFTFLSEIALPELVKRGGGVRRPLRLWSAGCSNGAEPYSLAMVCQDFAGRQAGFQFRVLGTDISSSMLRMAQRAIYPHAMIDSVPLEWRKRYLLRCQDSGQDEVRIAPELRQLVSYAYVNLIWEAYPIEYQVEVLFCRNVLIYFDKPTQRAVLSRLCRHLVDGGYLILGHSETITGLSLPLQAVAPTVFVRERSI